MARLKLGNRPGLCAGRKLTRLTDRIRDGAIETHRLVQNAHAHRERGLPIGFAMARLKRGVGLSAWGGSNRNGLPIGFAMARLKQVTGVIVAPTANPARAYRSDSRWRD